MRIGILGGGNMARQLGLGGLRTVEKLSGRAK